MRDRWCFACALLLVLPPVVRGADRASAPREIPLAVEVDGRIGLAVHIDGAGPFRFRVDTGASRTVVGARLAARLDLPAAGSSRTITHTDDVHRALVTLAELSIGGVSAGGVAALVVDERRLDAAGRIDGLIGQDVLSRWTYTVDFRAARLVLDADPAAVAASAVRVPLVRSAGGLLAIVAQPRTASQLRLVPDSGADHIVLFKSAGAALPPMTILQIVRVRSIGGAEQPARLVRLAELDVAGLRLPPADAVLLERPAPGGVMGDGLLPLHLFARATFDLARGVLALEPR